MRRFVVSIGSLLLVLSWTAPAGALTKTVSAKEYSFSPTPIRVAQGVTVEWSNDGAFDHTSTQNDSLDLWDTGSIAPGSTADFTMTSAGTFPYHCTFHAALGMTGVVKVPVRVSPTSGKVGDTFTVTVATVNAASGFVFDIQKRTGTGPWTKWKFGVIRRNKTFTPSAAGTYSFRSRLHRTSNNGVSKFSPATTITIAAA